MESGAGARKTVGRFGHSGTINTFFTRLGLFRDNSSLTAANYNSMRQRRWRTSAIAPMSANFILVLYSCPQVSPMYRVMASVNEKAVLIPGCRDVLCDYDELALAWKPFVEACSMDELCRYDAYDAGRSSVGKLPCKTTVMILTVVILLRGYVTWFVA